MAIVATWSEASTLSHSSHCLNADITKSSRVDVSSGKYYVRVCPHPDARLTVLWPSILRTGLYLYATGDLSGLERIKNVRSRKSFVTRATMMSSPRPPGGGVCRVRVGVVVVTISKLSLSLAARRFISIEHTFNYYHYFDRPTVRRSLNPSFRSGAPLSQLCTRNTYHHPLPSFGSPPQPSRPTSP